MKYSASSICFSKSFEGPSRRDIAECLADERTVGSLRGSLGRIINSAWASAELSTPRKGIFQLIGWKRCFPSWKCLKIDRKFHRWALMGLYSLASHTFTTAEKPRKKKLPNRNQWCILLALPFPRAECFGASSLYDIYLPYGAHPLTSITESLFDLFLFGTIPSSLRPSYAS